MKKSIAFTLAEVLITLGIIGVFAALTIPTLINNYEKQATVTRLKKAYSVLNQAVSLSEAENGRFSDNYTPVVSYGDSYHSAIENYLVKYIKINKNCRKSSEKDCFAD